MSDADDDADDGGQPKKRRRTGISAKDAWALPGGLNGDQALNVLRDRDAKKRAAEQEAEDKRKKREDAKAARAEEMRQSARELEEQVNSSENPSKTIDKARAEYVRELLFLRTGDESKRNLSAKDAKGALKAQMDV